jgi:hypothetical protein
MMDYSDMTIWQLKVERDKINAELELRTNVRASPSEANSESVEEIVGKMLRIYGVPFTDAISRKVAVETWARQLEDAALSGDQQP